MECRLVLKKYVLIHNHPDGSKEPSDDDKYSTNLINKIADDLQISMYDHIIIFPGGYYSFRGN